MPKFAVDPETTKAPKPVPGDQWYELKLKGIECKLNNAGDSYNYNAQIVVVNNKPEYNDHVVYFLMPLKGAQAGRKIADFCHAFSFHLEPDGSLPGGQAAWKVDNDKDPDMKDKKTTAKYSGPMLGRITKALLKITSYQGNERNQVMMFECKVKDCATKHPDIKHQTNLIGKEAA